MSPEASQGTEQAKTPSGMAEAVQMFKDDQAKAATAKAAETEAAAKAAEKKPEGPAPAPEGKEAAAEPAGPKFRLVNEKGEDAPFSFKADGKDLAETDLGKVKKYAELGYHASQRLEELNAREKVLNEKAAIIELVDQAMKDGRLVIKETAEK